MPKFSMSESALRDAARRRGYQLRKGRGPWSVNNQGEYMLCDSSNFVVIGGDFDASLTEVAAVLRG